MYADDLLLISACVSGLQSTLDTRYGLQSMLDICYSFGQRHLMIFNSKKSLCRHFWPGCLQITPIKLGAELIEFKYLGFAFVSAPTFQVDSNVIKKQLYAACYRILCHRRRNCELLNPSACHY